MKKITLLYAVLALAFNSVSGQTVFDWDTNANDNGISITETIDGITVTFTNDDPTTPQNEALINPGGYGGSSGFVVYSSGESELVTFTFDQPVDVNSILAIDAIGRNVDYTFTPTGGANSPVVASLVGGVAPPVNLNWTNVTSFTVTSGGAGMAFDNLSVSGLAPTAIQVNPKVYLQGAGINPNTGEGTLMRDDLRVAGNIPTTSPYADALTCNASVFTPTGSDAIVDWVFVELRDENDNSVVLDSQSALLQRDGDVVGADGLSPLSFNSAAGNYFVSVNHRNHLGVVSASAIALSGTAATVDFTASSASAEGGANALTVLGNGNFAIYAGDFDANAQVQNTDASGVTLLIGGSGYSDADIDTNVQVQNTDLQNLVYPNIGKGQQFSRLSSSGNGTSSIVAPGINITFANAQITNDGANDFYEVDVFIDSSEDFKLGSGQFYINYSTAAFGTNVSANGKIEYLQPAGSILAEDYGFPAYKDFIKNDNTDSRVSVSFQQGVSSGTITANNVTASPKLLCHLKLEYTDAGQAPMIAFETGAVFLDQFYTACGPAGAGPAFPDCTNEPGEQITNDAYDSSGAVLGVSDKELTNIVMYPNPTRKGFYIEGLKERSSVSIFDMNGRIILRRDHYLGAPIEIAEFNSGIYLVRIENINGVGVKRLIKQ